MSEIKNLPTEVLYKERELTQASIERNAGYFKEGYVEELKQYVIDLTAEIEKRAMSKNIKTNQPTKESLITNYTSALQAIYDHVGFVEDWVICPIDDRATEFYWYIDDEGVHYADSLEELESGEGNSYSDEIYTQHFYKKHIYEGADYTMIFCDPHTDSMKWFRVFDNLKRINRNE